jgi:hypothetical protein
VREIAGNIFKLTEAAFAKTLNINPKAALPGCFLRVVY